MEDLRFFQTKMVMTLITVTEGKKKFITRPPVLMLPSREQDYSDSYFRAVFPKAVRLLRETRVLVLVGYSFPKDDALIGFILRQFAEEPEDGRGKWIFYIDPDASEKKYAAISIGFSGVGKTLKIIFRNCAPSMTNSKCSPLKCLKFAN